MSDKDKTYTVTADQLADLDRIRQLLYMLSLEPNLPRPLDEQVHVAAYKLYYWLQQFKKPLALKESAERKRKDGTVDKWPDTHHELWAAHK